MIVSPTRELAIQIFNVLFKIGKAGHLFSAGLVIGGKSLQEEQHALVRMNIVVCTPGRILQHLSQTAAFNVDSLQMLVLDEADRILDMGFQRDLDAIIEYLPTTRQTLLFSATQTKRVSDLARLSLRNPEYIAVHDAATSSTPHSLQQNYIVTPLDQKLDTLWSFIASAKKSKLLVFLSSGKQVRHIYESFRKLRPGTPLLHLHGRQRMTARINITSRFAAATSAVLFSTDIAARGLDFPHVDWVVQLDCPEDADTYIHRVGRTARFDRNGRAVLFLDPSEEHPMLTRLADRRVPVERINVRARKQRSIRDQLAGLCFRDPELKYLAQKAFASYVRSIRVMKDKDVFNLEEYPLDAYASSLGLPGAPKIRFTRGDADEAKRLKNAPRRDADLSPDREDQAKREEASKPRTKYDRMFARVNQSVLAPHYTSMIDRDDDDNASSPQAQKQDHESSFPNNNNEHLSDQDDLFTVKSRHVPTQPSHTDSHHEQPPSNRRTRALKSRKHTARLLGAPNTRLIFDETTGEARAPHLFDTDETDRVGADAQKERREDFVAESRRAMGEADVRDREMARERRREKRDRKKGRERGEGRDGDGREGSEESDAETADGLEPFAELADLYDADDDHNQNEGGERKPKKKKRVNQDEDTVFDPETVEDLEQAATDLLN